MPLSNDGIEQQSPAKVILLMIALFVGGVMSVLRTSSDSIVHAHVLAMLILVVPAFVLAHADNKYLVPYLVLVWAIAPEVRRYVDWLQGEFHPRSLISVAPMAATLALAIPVSRQRIIVTATLYRALGSLALALSYAGIVGYIRNELPAVFEFAATVAPFLVILYASGRPMEPRERDLWVRSIVAVAVFVAAYGVVQYVYAPPWDVMWMQAVQRDIIAIGKPEPYGIRVFSTMGAPLQCSLFLMTALVPMLVEPRWRRLTGYVMAGLIGYALLLTITRTAWVALAAGVLFYFLTTKGVKKIQALAGTLVVAALIWLALPYLPGYETISGRIESMTELKTDTSATARQSLARTAWDAISKNPVGTGMGSFGMGTRLARSPAEFRSGFDNGYIGIALSYGWFGALFFLRGIWLLVKAVRELRTDPEREPYVRLALAMGVAYLVYTASAYGAGVFVMLLAMSLPFGLPKPAPAPEPEPLYLDAARPLRRRLGAPDVARSRTGQ